MVVKFAFNIWNYDIADIFFDICSKNNASIILQTSQSVVDKIDKSLFIKHIKNLKENYNKTDIIINLDHATKIGLIKDCINLGWDMVMYDGSSLDYEENLKNTRTVVNYAHNKNVKVEGELGKIPGVEDNKYDKEEISNLNLIKNYVSETNIDYLALSIGNKHGLYKEKNIDINYNLLKNVNGQIDIPLVLHGGSGLSSKILKRCVKSGIKKINISTEVKITYFDAIEQINKLGIKHYLKAKDILYESIEKLFDYKINSIEGK